MRNDVTVPILLYCVMIALFSAVLFDAAFESPQSGISLSALTATGKRSYWAATGFALAAVVCFSTSSLLARELCVSPAWVAALFTTGCSSFAGFVLLAISPMTEANKWHTGGTLLATGSEVTSMIVFLLATPPPTL